MSGDSFTQERNEPTINTEQGKRESNKEIRGVKKVARPSQASKPKEKQRTTKERSSITIQSSKGQAKLMDRMSKSIEKQSKSIERLGTQIASLQNRLVHTEKTVSDAMTFMKNRGWKRKGKKK
ncbi:MAG TPA: hypothetical protein VJ250_01620 [Nitrososphaeraceae archaeon]|nr:hypothetical protein [Nitrososphaeraceae archaeon]